jgi:hypothetical protein
MPKLEGTGDPYTIFLFREENKPQKNTSNNKRGEGRRILQINFRDSDCGKFDSV